MNFLDSSSTIGVLFSLFYVKDIENGKWISFGSQLRKKVFEHLTSNFKHFKDQFFKVLASKNEFPFFLDEKDYAKFPLYWNRIPKRVLSINYHSLSAYDQVVLNFLSEHLTSKKKVLS